MTLFIQNDTGTAGSGSVFPSSGSLHLIAISNGDPGYGENPAVGDLIPVTYAQSTTGPCPTRLTTLVNTDFPTPTGTIDIIIIPSNNGFVLIDGSVVGPGITLRPNSPINPANSVIVIYDTTNNGGSGICVKREGGSAMDVQSPASVILYHELSHAFRRCTNATLSTAESNCNSASAEENAAEIDENDMRDQLGIPHRDATNHCANVGCQTNCCIVASVVSGSAYSAEVNALRDVRDRFLRQSNVGFEFFERLHSDYYAFSPQVCGMMARSAGLKSQVHNYFVQPLTEILRLIYEYTANHCTKAELGSQFDAVVTSSPTIASLGVADVTDLERVLGNTSLPAAPDNRDDLFQLESLLRERAHGSEFVKWALIDPLSIYLEGLRHRLAECDSLTLGLRLADTIDAWAARMPITDVWSKLSWYDRSSELEFLARALLRTPQARREFGARLLAFFDGDERMSELLRDRGLLAEETTWLT
jgi:hypothetical protein